jgi:ElaA protein
MEYAHKTIEEKFPEEKSISIMAQSYLLNWYGKLGYEAQGAEFMEDGIPHHKMVRETFKRVIR